MKIAVMGTGVVGNMIGFKLIQLGYQVMMGSRNPHNENAVSWSKKNGPNASNGSFDDASRFGEIIFLCTKGDATLEALKLVKKANFNGKTIIDLTNGLDFSKGMPPSLMISNDNSLGEEVQKALPEANVVKTLNIVSNEVMVDPKKTGGEPTMFISGNNPDAKITVKNILIKFGWTDIIDLGDITGARGMEMLLPIWLRLWQTLQNGDIGFKIVRKQ